MVCRYKRGYKNVINKGIELNNAGTDAALMMETRYRLKFACVVVCPMTAAIVTDRLTAS